MRGWIFVIAMVAACSSGSGGSGKGSGSKDATASDTPTAADDVEPSDEPTRSTVKPGSGCIQLGSAICQAMVKCGGGILESLAGTKSHCDKVTAHQCAELAALPGSSLTDSAAWNCATSAASQSCSSLLSSGPPPACEASFTGKLTSGAACYEDVQCAGGNCNKDFTDGPCGFCEETVPEGGSCHGGTECDPGLKCAFSEVCVTPASVGQPCGEEMRCADGLTCKNDTCATVPADTSYTPKPKPGEPCDPDSSGIFINGRCRADARCDEALKKCIPRFDEGGACTKKDECMPGLHCIEGKCAFKASPVCQ